MAAIDRETLRELRDAVLKELRQWLDSEAALEAWCTGQRQVSERILAAPVASVIDIDAVADAIAAFHAEGFVDGTARPAARFLIRQTAARASARTEPLGELVGTEACAALATLAGRADAVNEALLRALAEDEAMEQLMKDVLYEALLQFSERVNPFVAEWGLPALLDQLPLFGKGALRKAFDGMRAEFDRRLEPEIKKFLQGFARKALEKMIASALGSAGEPQLVAMRQQLARTLLERPLAELCWPPGEERTAQLEDALVASLTGVLRHPSMRRELVSACRELHAAWAARTLGEVLTELGIVAPDTTPFAKAVWPALRQAASEPLLSELSRQLDAAHERWLTGRE